jgi:hypothetical protein
MLLPWHCFNKHLSSMGVGKVGKIRACNYFLPHDLLAGDCVKISPELSLSISLPALTWTVKTRKRVISFLNTITIPGKVSTKRATHSFDYSRAWKVWCHVLPTFPTSSWSTDISCTPSYGELATRKNISASIGETTIWDNRMRWSAERMKQFTC